MRNKERKYAVLLVLVVGLFCFGVIRLFMLRFEEGDVYPPYSSLRRDPLGTGIFYDALHHMPGVAVQRNYQPLYRAGFENNITLLYLGADKWEHDFYDKKVIAHLEQLVSSGGRLVISFFPQKITPLSGPDLNDVEKDEKEKEDQPPPKADKVQAEKENKSDDKVSQERQDRFKRFLSGKKKNPREKLSEKWQFAFGREEGALGLENAKPAENYTHVFELPSLPWHTSLYFDDLGEAWQVVYRRNKHPVVIEKQIGKGSIVLSSESFYFSNESLFKERQTNLLIWLLGKKNSIVFDESHFGIQENIGVVDLARKYRLYGFVLGGLILAGLFIWKSASGFVPPRQEEEVISEQGMPSTRDYKEGMVSLLRRNIPAQNILRLCVEEWRKSFAPGKKMSEHTADILNSIETALAGDAAQSRKKKDAAGTYRLISKIVNKGKMT